MSKKSSKNNAEHDSWKENIMTNIRKAMKEVDPEIEEAVKWKVPSNPKGVFVWYMDGMICTGETYKKHLRISFAKGLELKEFDKNGLINSYRAIIIKEEDTFNIEAFKDLVESAIKLNKEAKLKKKAKQK